MSIAGNESHSVGVTFPHTSRRGPSRRSMNTRPITAVVLVPSKHLFASVVGLCNCRTAGLTRTSHLAVGALPRGDLSDSGDRAILLPRGLSWPPNA